MSNMEEKKYKIFGNRIVKNKIIIILTVLLVVAVFVTRRCTNTISNMMSKNGDNAVTEINQIDKYDLSIYLGNYGVYNDITLKNYLIKITDTNIKNIKLKRLIDFSSYHFSNFDWAQKNGYYALNVLKEDAYFRATKTILKKNQDWSNLPVSENLISKFNPKEGCLLDLNIESKQSTKLQLYDFKNKTFIVTCTNEDGSTDDYNYRFVLDNDENIDDVVFVDIVHRFDKNGEYIIYPNKYLMDSESSAETVLYHILPNKSYFFFDGDEGYNWKTDDNSHWNIIQELGVTDTLMKQHDDNDGLLPIKKVEEINIYDIDINNKTAKVNVTTNEEDKNYNIVWEIDKDNKLSSISIDEI